MAETSNQIAAIPFLLTVALLAYFNGANNNFKGVATLLGSGTTSYGRALWLAMFTSLAGSLTAIFLGQALIEAFSGKGLVSAEVLANPGFLQAVGGGAALTVLLATPMGFPVSTTHALIGALFGACLLVRGGGDHSRLVNGLVLPLLLTPAASMAATFVLYLVLRRVRLASGIFRVHQRAAESPAIAESGMFEERWLSAKGLARGNRSVGFRHLFYRGRT